MPQTLHRAVDAIEQYEHGTGNPPAHHSDQTTKESGARSELDNFRSRPNVDNAGSVRAEFQWPNANMFARSVRLKIGIHEIHEINDIQQICEIYLPKYRNPVQLCEIHCLKV